VFAHALSAVAEIVTSTGGGTATINTDGGFKFLPGVGDKNQNDTFTYHVTDGSAQPRAPSPSISTTSSSGM